MLKTRVIPTLLWKGLGLVKGVGFNSWRRVGTVLPSLKVYNSRDVDELILLDITATPEGRDPDHESVGDFSTECSVPLTVGGGIRNLAQITQLLHAGADKVSLNSACIESPQLVAEAAGLFGSQCVVVSIDAKRMSDGTYRVHSRCGTKMEALDPWQWARTMEECGAGEILLTSIDRDGTMQGYDIELISRVASEVDIPVIASGGAGAYEHMIEAILKGGASAVAAASMFHFTEQTPAGAKIAMQAAGIPVRRSTSRG